MNNMGVRVLQIISNINTDTANTICIPKKLDLRGSEIIFFLRKKVWIGGSGQVGGTALKSQKKEILIQESLHKKPDKHDCPSFQYHTNVFKLLPLDNSLLLFGKSIILLAKTSILHDILLVPVAVLKSKGMSALQRSVENS